MEPEVHVVEVAPTPAGVLHQRVIDRWALLLAAAGMHAEPSPVTTQGRRWTPMDGAEPPYCPFVDEWRTVQQLDGSVMELSTSVPYWNDTDPSGAFMALTVKIGDSATEIVWSRAGQVGGMVDGWCAHAPVAELPGRLLGALLDASS